MYAEQEMMRLLHALVHRIDWQESRLREMQLVLKRLEEEISALGRQRMTRIDRVEYHFDQLKVEKLEGTLNIGLTPGEQGEIGQLAVDQQPLQHAGVEPASAAPQGEAYTALFKEAEQYTAQELPVLIREMEDRFNIRLDENYRELMIEDIQRQMDSRIQTYMMQYEQSGGANGDAGGMQSWVMERTKRDVREGVRLHFEKIAQGREQA